MTQAGKYRHEITINTPVAGADSYGDAQTAFTKLGDYRARMWTKSNNETVDGQVRLSRVLYNFELRYESALDGLSPASQITFNGKTLEVLTVENKDNMNRHIWIVAEERRGP